ncbi:unnamed protein product [Lupinus luteus]|uniref:Uncharacterized protein n=1 Tax=Lupinus luteus TaxID=3873 RepID=A0AAV1X2E6_LUPLU
MDSVSCSGGRFDEALQFIWQKKDGEGYVPGSVSQVYMAKEIKTGEIVALKKVRMDNEREGRITAKDALDAEYFWSDPFPCDPKSLPKYESSHEFQTKKKRQQQRHTRLPPIQQSEQHAQMQPGPNQQGHGSQQVHPGGPDHHYGMPRVPSGGPGRYPPSANPGGGYNHPDHGLQGGAGGHGSGPYPPQGRGAPYSPQGRGAPYPPQGRGEPYPPEAGGGSFGVGAPNYTQQGPYGGSAGGRGSNMMGGNDDQ